MREIKRGFIIFLACCFFVVGIVGMVLPVFQGIIFVFIAIALLTLSSRRARHYTDQLTEKHPKIRAFIHKTREWLQHHIFGRVD